MTVPKVRLAGLFICDCPFARLTLIEGEAKTAGCNWLVAGFKTEEACVTDDETPPIDTELMLVPDDCWVEVREPEAKVIVATVVARLELEGTVTVVVVPVAIV